MNNGKLIYDINFIILGFIWIDFYFGALWPEHAKPVDYEVIEVYIPFVRDIIDISAASLFVFWVNRKRKVYYLLLTEDE